MLGGANQPRSEFAMDRDFDSVFRDVYSARLDHPPNVEVRTIPASVSPVQLVLAIQVPVSLARAPAAPPQGAILEIPLDKEAAIDIFRGIRKVAQTMGWSLPKEDEGLA
jgi:hypothetical protein